MKIYGYSNNVDTEKGPLEMSEISFCADPEDLRVVALFLSQRADEMDNHSGFGHSHLRDSWKDWSDDFPDVIVLKPSMESAK